MDEHVNEVEHADNAPETAPEQESAGDRVSELEGALEELRTALEESRASLLAAERGRKVDEALIELRAVDLETARAMLEKEMLPEQDDVRAAAVSLRRRKPFLFRGVSAASGGAAMGGRPRAGSNGVETHARAAAETGDRGALLTYLRARRENGSA